MNELDKIYQQIGRRYTLDYVAIGSGIGRLKPKNCKKGWNCGYSCQSKEKKNCRSAIQGQAKTYADWMAEQTKKTPVNSDSVLPKEIHPSELKRGQKVSFLVWGREDDKGVIPTYERQVTVTNITPDFITVKPTFANDEGARHSIKLERSPSGKLLDGRFYPINSEPSQKYTRQRADKALSEMQSLKSKADKSQKQYEQMLAKSIPSDSPEYGAYYKRLQSLERTMLFHRSNLRQAQGEIELAKARSV